MDIPSSGAIFTLGKSYLAENTQSYFYIKNDPIRRLIAGPYQSAVICESGRLFVWGENQYGQLGISNNKKNNNNNNSSNNNNGENIVIKPTCVKYLKTLQLKATDLAFGDDWSVILTHSNEIFFSGRSIFTTPNSLDDHLVTATVNNETYQLIQQPVKLKEFDTQLNTQNGNSNIIVENGSTADAITTATSTATTAILEVENYVKILAGNEHFVVLTSIGRLIGWGSNESHQLGVANREEPLMKPHEIILDSAIQQIACGPESTLVLTEKSNLYLTGRLNEFIFPQFTELQKNLSNNEVITFMHISQSNEIFIVTNKGSIYRSFESVRNKSLIFQRFYDYDSEENDAIWKLLKGDAFCAVLTTTQKFYTTFSESGHHLKTFREISKFKNLRLLDMALGVQHILVHGIPRSTTLSHTLVGTLSAAGSGTEAAIQLTQAEGLKKLKPIQRNVNNDLNDSVQATNEKDSNLYSDLLEKSAPNNDTEYPAVTALGGDLIDNNTENLNNSLGTTSTAVADTLEDNKSILEESSRTATPLSFRSVYSVKQDHISDGNADATNSVANEKRLRPRTPYPEQLGEINSTITPLHNDSYETTGQIENTDIQLESLNDDNAILPKHPGVKISTPTPPPEEDEELMVEISQTTDPLDHTLILNEIRFINNGIDVTASVKKQRYSTDSQADDERIIEAGNVLLAKSKGRETEAMINEKEQKTDDNQNQNQQLLEDMKTNPNQSIQDKVTEKTLDKRHSPSNAFEDKKTEQQSVKPSTPKKEEEWDNNTKDSTDDVKTSMGHTLRKVADDTLHVVQSVTSKISNDMLDAKSAITSILPSKKNKVDTERNLPSYDKVITETTDNSTTTQFAANGITEDNNSTSKQQQKLNHLQTTGHEDDERTTASVNSTHSIADHSADNHLEQKEHHPSNNNKLSTNEEKSNLDDGHTDGNLSNQHQQYAGNNPDNGENENADSEETNKSKLCKFMNGIRMKTKHISCRNEKSLRIDDDQPPRYTEEDELAARQIGGNEHGSKVCIIL